MRLTQSSKMGLSWRIKAMVTAALALAACTSQPSDTQAKPAVAAAHHPESGLLVIPLTIAHGNQRHAFKVEVARDSMAQAKGLMFRTKMGADEGMIFPMDPARPASFWMKNTVLPLDIVFIGPDRRVLNIAADAVPYSETPILSAGRVSAVLELNGGRTAALRIMPGDLVNW